MKFYQVVAFFVAACFLMFSTLISWYEGAKLLDIPWEWQHTAIFSTWLHGEVHAPGDILAIDHFVYAAKFQPLFPFLLITSALVMLFQLAGWIFRKKFAAMNGFLLTMAVVFFGASVSLANSPASGFSFFAFYFAVLSIASLFYTAVRWKKEKKDSGNPPFQSIFYSRNK